MKKHPLICLLLTLSLLLSASACSAPIAPEAPTPEQPTQQAPAEEAEKPPFTLAFYENYSLHPALADNRANLSLSPLLYEGLFALDASFEAVPVLCREYSVSQNGLTWTFALQEGVTFSDGTPLTGSVAAKALKTALGKDSRYAGRIPELRGISGKDQTVTVTLTRPNGTLPALLDIPLALDDSERPLGTGAYVLCEENGRFSLTARADWWQEKALPFQSILLSGIQQTDDLIAAFDSGAVTLLDADLTGTNALGYSGNYEVWDYNTTQFLYLGFNTASGFCKDPQVRQAISRGIDRDSLTSVSYARHAQSANLPIHPANRYYSKSLSLQAAYDPQVLVNLLGRTAAPKTPLRLLVNSENNAKVSAAEHIAYQLGAEGLQVTVEKLPWSDYLTALQNGAFDLYLGEVLLTADFDLTALLSSSGALNYGLWQDAQTDLLLSQLRAADDNARLAASRALYSYLNQTVPIAPLSFKNGSVLTQWGRLTGLSPCQNNIFSALENWQLDF